MIIEYMFDKILIANRGEIALRIHRACREMGIQTVAVHSTADSDAMHVRLADESVCIGPPPARDSYLNIPAILVGRHHHRRRRHPSGLRLPVGERALRRERSRRTASPSSARRREHIRMMGDKIVAKQTAQASSACRWCRARRARSTRSKRSWRCGEKIGWPVLIKAVAGGGGRGMKVVDDAEASCRGRSRWPAREAKAAFGNDSVYLEKYLDQPRHIEIQVLGDGQGDGVHLGERDCSLQRRHQKVLEEAPSPGAQRRAAQPRSASSPRRRCASSSYRGAGTMEFLFQDGEFYFIEMNTRLQVEHPITEAVTGIDLVREQIRIAAGARARHCARSDIVIHGHAIECRINAENPETFVPSPGQITDYHPPGGLGVRVDSGLYTGYSIPPYYDSMVAKLIVNGPSRNECLMRLRRSLEEFVIGGIETTIPLHQEIIQQQEFIDGDYDIHWLEKLVGLKK